MAQQTAVEWLIEELELDSNLYLIKDIVDKAKEMEKRKAFEYFKAGQDSMEEEGKSFDQYYTQTYGK
jgi:hypothetical protein